MDSRNRMRMKKEKRNFSRDERAVSEVLGFVLILGIVLSATSIYISQQIPTYTKEYESIHTTAVEEDFAELKSLVDGIVLVAQQGGEVAAGTTPVKMSPDKVPLIGMAPPGSNIFLNPEAEKIEIGVPIEEGGGGGGGGVDWEHNSTTGFPYIVTASSNVVNTSDDVRLAKYSEEEEDLELDGESIWLNGDHYYNNVIISNDSILYAYGFLTIYANNISVEEGSQIIGDGKGLSGGTAEKDGEGFGFGGVGNDTQHGGAGAGYGASGGDGGNDAGGIGGSTGGASYGSENSSSIQMGSGGGGGGPTPAAGAGGTGGDGGGAIWLDAETIDIAGDISADGDDGLSGSATTAGAGGGGSGGGILICGRNVILSGTLSAKGGDGGDSGSKGGGGGGAGGRIKVFYETLDNSSADYSDGVSGGDGYDGGAEGGTGSIYHEQISGGSYVSALTHQSSGYFVSEVHDTGTNSTCYGEMTWNETVEADTSIVMRVRTAMFENMVGTPDWPYCPVVSNGSDISGLSSVSDGHRYVQYRAELATDKPEKTPVLDMVKINYTTYASGTGPTISEASGRIKFQSNYLYYPNQEVIYEHGAVIRSQKQPEGEFMYQSPPITISNESGIPTIEITMVDLTGADYSYSGITTISVETSKTDYNLHSNNLRFPNLTLNVTTEYPSTWADWLNETLAGSGLTEYNETEPDKYYDYKPPDITGNLVTVEFIGHENGVQLYLEKTTVAVAIKR